MKPIDIMELSLMTNSRDEEDIKEITRMMKNDDTKPNDNFDWDSIYSAKPRNVELEMVADECIEYGPQLSEDEYDRQMQFRMLDQFKESKQKEEAPTPAPPPAEPPFELIPQIRKEEEPVQDLDGLILMKD